MSFAPDGVGEFVVATQPMLGHAHLTCLGRYAFTTMQVPRRIRVDIMLIIGVPNLDQSWVGIWKSTKH